MSGFAAGNILRFQEVLAPGCKVPGLGAGVQGVMLSGFTLSPKH